MLSRALALATMMGLIGCCAMAPAQAQENLEAGQSAAHIYAGACSSCHKSTHGLLKTVRRGSLAGFLREHYTTGPAMAALLADYLLSHGADDARFVAGPHRGRTKQATRSETRPTNPIEQLFDSFGHRRHSVSQEAAPASQAQNSDAKPGERETAARRKHRARRAAGETAKPGAKEHATSTEPVSAPTREGHKAAAKQHADSHPKPELGEAPKGTVRQEPKPNGAADKVAPEASKSEAAKEGPGPESPKSSASNRETAKVDEGKQPGAKPVSEAPRSANAEPPKQDEKDSKAGSAPRPGSAPAATASHAAAAVAPAVSAAAPPPAPPATTTSTPPAGKPVPPASN